MLVEMNIRRCILGLFIIDVRIWLGRQFHHSSRKSTNNSSPSVTDSASN